MDYMGIDMNEVLVKEYKSAEEIINLSAEKNIIVQGDTDDDKIELILKRLSHLKQNDRKMRLSGVKIIAPDKQYKYIIESRIAEFNINEIEVCSIEEYYSLLIKRFAREITAKTDILDEEDLSQSALGEIYSEKYSKKTEDNYTNYWKKNVEALKENNLVELCKKSSIVLPDLSVFNYATYQILLKTLDAISENIVFGNSIKSF